MLLIYYRSPCTGCYKLFLVTLYGGPAAAVRQCHLNNIHFYYYYYYYRDGKRGKRREKRGTRSGRGRLKKGREG